MLRLTLSSLRRILMGVCLGVLVVLLLMPNTFLRFLRVQYRWIGVPMNWVEAHSASINLAHLIAFLVVGFAARLAMPGRSRATLAIIVAVAIVSEIAQFWVPGRTPRMSDVGVDVAGTLAGAACAGLLLWLSRAWLRGEAQPGK
ncbi:MAG TPA: VanZ family protein [Ramlibacter sp.]|uniref:VanZ family protein n=1 Tax=Ramlibacter sp. TaxID=1917967 RepID=UPI002D80C811|nr:VanZ family protein [Ramlibacter sp.]HET8744170.1 VanZ family protein [Ramlibacter sp.]